MLQSDLLLLASHGTMLVIPLVVVRGSMHPSFSLVSMFTFKKLSFMVSYAYTLFTHFILYIKLPPKAYSKPQQPLLTLTTKCRSLD